MEKKSLRGVYFNLEDSTYIATNDEIYLFFSSASKLGKFLAGYGENREKIDKKIDSAIGENSFSFGSLSDVNYYLHCETKGFYVLLNGKEITKEEFESYTLECILQNKTIEFKPVSSPSDIEQIRETIDRG